MSEFIFAYGSLMDEESCAVTCKTVSVRPARVRGFSRRWNVFSAKKRCVFLGVVADPSRFCRGCLIEVDSTALGALDKREGSYVRVALDRDDVQAELPAGKHSLWIYVPRAECTVPVPGLAVTGQYLIVVRRACEKLGAGAWEEMLADTQGWRLCERAAGEIGLALEPLIHQV